MSNQRNLPLYRGIGYAEAPASESVWQSPTFAQANPGLLFDRYVDHWDANWQTRDPEKGVMGSKQSFYTAVCQAANRVDEAQLHQALSRQQHLVESQGGTNVSLTLEWRFVTGTGEPHVFENGFTWHPVLGVPYLPGSSLKGLLRAWALEWLDDEQSEFVRLFGPGAEEEDDRAVGSIIVFDALPNVVPRVVVDVTTPHYRRYYENPDTEAPADYHEPVPSFFLTVEEGARYAFGLAPRDRNQQGREDLRLATELLTEALSELGAGAKTAVGYGRFDETAEDLDINQNAMAVLDERHRVIDQAAMSPLDALKSESDRLSQWEKKENRESLFNSIDRWIAMREDIEEKEFAQGIELLLTALNSIYPGIRQNPNPPKKSRGKSKGENRQWQKTRDLLKIENEIK